MPIPALKIDVVVESIAVPEGTKSITSRRLENVMQFTPDPEKAPRPTGAPIPQVPEISLVEEAYYLHTMQDISPDGSIRLRHFFLRADQADVFLDLVNMSANKVLKIGRQAEEKGYKAGYDKGCELGVDKGFDTCKEMIKDLPWYKRLFKQF